MDKWKTLFNWGRISRNTKPVPVDQDKLIEEDGEKIDFEILAAIKTDCYIQPKKDGR